MAQPQIKSNHIAYVDMDYRIAEPSVIGQIRTYVLGKKYKMFIAPSEEYLKMAIKNYCNNYGILEAKSMSKEEFDKQIKKARNYESNTQIQK